MAHRGPSRGLSWWRVVLLVGLGVVLMFVLAWGLYQFLLTRG